MLHSDDVARLVFPLLVVVSAALSGQAPPRPPAAETARALQEKYDRVRDFTADFTHTYEGGILKKTFTERGTVEIKKP